MKSNVRLTVSRQQAKDAGVLRYFTGKPCKYGHIEERIVYTGACLQCCRERERRKYIPKRTPANKKEIAQIKRGYAIPQQFRPSLPDLKNIIWTDDIINRFNAKFIKDELSGCWLWVGSVSRLGYGKFSIGRFMYVAPRLSLAIAGRAPGSEEFACHTCDNPRCVNPDHLFVGTRQDNIIDMHQKGRAAIGERMPTAKLTANLVREIRSLRGVGHTQKSLAIRFGVGQMTISRIVRGQMWSHVK